MVIDYLKYFSALSAGISMAGFRPGLNVVSGVKSFLYFALASGV